MKRLENLAKPPRHVPFDVNVKARLGGFLQQFGWVFFTFGMLFVVLFVSHGNLAQAVAKELAFRGAHATVQGVVTRAEETNAEENEQDVVLFFFEYEVEGQKFFGECYFTGWRYDEGDSVKVVYSPEDPGLAKIVDGRWSHFSIWVGLLVFLFPGIGLALVLSSLPNCNRSAKLLKYGRLSYGEMVSKEATNTQINEQTVFEFTFKFKAESTGREHLVKSRTHVTSNLEDEEFEPILYLANQPEQAVLFDNLPGNPSVTPQGQLKGGNPLGALAYLFLPVLGVLMASYVVNDVVQAFSN